MDKKIEELKAQLEEAYIAKDKAQISEIKSQLSVAGYSTEGCTPQTCPTGWEWDDVLCKCVPDVGGVDQ